MSIYEQSHYDILRQKAEDTFWQKFEELGPRHPNVDMGKLRDIAKEMFDEYIKFMELRKKLADHYPERRQYNTFGGTDNTITQAAQAGLAFIYFRIVGSEDLSVDAITQKKEHLYRDYHYSASAEECLNLGREGAIIFGSLVARLRDSVRPEYDNYIQVDDYLITYKDHRPHSGRLLKLQLRFASDNITSR